MPRPSPRGRNPDRHEVRQTLDWFPSPRRHPGPENPSKGSGLLLTRASDTPPAPDLDSAGPAWSPPCPPAQQRVRRLLEPPRVRRRLHPFGCTAVSPRATGARDRSEGILPERLPATTPDSPPLLTRVRGPRLAPLSWGGCNRACRRGSGPRASWSLGSRRKGPESGVPAPRNKTRQPPFQAGRAAAGSKRRLSGCSGWRRP